MGNALIVKHVLLARDSVSHAKHSVNSFLYIVYSEEMLFLFVNSDNKTNWDLPDV